MRVGPRLRAALTALAVLAGVAVPAGAAQAFITPDYPSANCTPVASGGTRYGLAPQQWRSAVGLPLTPEGTPLPQRIVLLENGMSANVDAVNALMVQCGLPTVSSSLNVTSTLVPPSSTAPGIEAALDASIAASALPPGASLSVVNSGFQAGFYGMLASAAVECGLVFGTAPPGDLPPLTKGPSYPAGGCLISVSYVFSEAGMLGSGDMTYTDAILQQLADLGVIVAFAAGDEGSGGCVTYQNYNYGDAVLVPVTSVQVTSGTWTVTTSTPHGFAPGQRVWLNVTTTVGDHPLYGSPTIVATPTATTFTFTDGTATGPLEAVAGVASVDFGGTVPGWPASNPNALAVGGTQWAPQSVTTALPPFGTYTPGTTADNYVWHDINANSNCANQPDYPFTGGQGTGGGLSATYPRPAYQSAVVGGAYPALPARSTTPDLSALAGWPAYAIANPGQGVSHGEVVSGTATLTTIGVNGISTGETVEVSGLPAPFSGTFTVTGSTLTSFSYSVSAPDTRRTRFSPTGTVSQSCASYPCPAADFPWVPVFGTSAATPLVVMGIANINAVLTAQGLPVIDNAGGAMDIHRIVYDPANAGVFSDVTQGDNDLFGPDQPGIDGYAALAGYDLASGVGVPNFAALAATLVGRLRPTPSPSPTATPSPTPSATPTPTPSTAPTASPSPASTPPNPSVAATPAPGVVVLSADRAADVPPRLLLREPAARPAAAPRVPATTRRPIALVVSGLEPQRLYRVSLDDGDERAVLGTTTTDADGLARLPVFQVADAGRYTVILRDSRTGATRFVRLIVASP